MPRVAINYICSLIYVALFNICLSNIFHLRSDNIINALLIEIKKTFGAYRLSR